MGGYLLGISKDLENRASVLIMEDEYCIIEVTQNFEKILMCFVYLSPSCMVTLFEIFERLDLDNNHCIVIGDMNARIGNYQSPSIMEDNISISNTRNSKDKVVNSRGRMLKNYLTSSFLKIMNGSTLSDPDGEFTFTNRNGSSVIDICLSTMIVSQYLDLEVLSSHESSHLPLLVSLNKETDPIYHNVPKIIWEPERSDSFRTHLKSYINVSQESPITLSMFNSSILCAAESSGLLKTRKIGGIRTNNYPQWFDQKCLASKKDVNLRLRNFRNSCDVNRYEAKHRYLDAKRSYNNLKKAKQTLHRNRIHQQLSNSRSCSEFYKALKCFNARNLDLSMKEHVKPAQFRDYYSELFRHEETVTTHYNTHIGTKKECSLDDEFSFSELNMAIKKLALKKAPGPDSVINEIWHALDTNQRLLLLDTINDMWRNCDVPSQLTEVLITPIFKKGDRKEACNYRPICLVNTSLKLITMLMANRLSEWCEENDKISPYQAAYRKGFGCESQVFALNAILQTKINTKNGRVFALFVDISKAFDSVVHSKLWIRLKNIGISPRFIAFIQAIYSNVNAKVRTVHGESDGFKLEKGVLQGESLSPKLFTIFMEQIVEILYQSDIPTLKVAAEDIHLLLYADDIVILASNAIDLQKKIGVLKEFFDQNNLSVNLGKTKCVVFRRKKSKRSSIPTLFWGENEVEVVDKYTYLGVTFYWNLDFGKTAEEFLLKAKVAEKHLFDIFRRSKMSTFDSRIKLFESLVRSVLMYCCPVWGLKCMKKLVIFQNKFLRRMFCLPNKTPAWFLRLELSVSSLEVYLIKSTLHFWRRIVCSNSIFLKNCYKSLVDNSSKSYSKTNWYKSLQEVLTEWDSEHIVNAIPDEGDLIEVNRLSMNINNCISRIENESISRDIIRMQNSSSMSHYCKIKTHCVREKYVNFNCNWNVTIHMMQLRANLSQVSGSKHIIKLNELSWFYNKNRDPNCKCCNQNQIENLYHVLFVCPRYDLIRHKYLKGVVLPNSEDDYASFVKDIDLSYACSVSSYLRFMIITRNIILGLD
jgi:hypothetical protein